MRERTNYSFKRLKIVCCKIQFIWNLFFHIAVSSMKKKKIDLYYGRTPVPNTPKLSNTPGCDNLMPLKQNV